MQIISRAALAATLVGPNFAGDGEDARIEEMSAFAAAILAHAPESVTHFVYTDHENGDDAVVAWPEYLTMDQLTSVELIPTTNAPGDYYGMYATQPRMVLADGSEHKDDRWLYQCYLGGCPASSAPGFVISTAIMVG